MIVARVRCPDCGLVFDLTGRQQNAGLIAPRERCGEDRRRRNRELGRIRSLRYRQRRRDAGSAPLRARTPTQSATALLTAP